MNRLVVFGCSHTYGMGLSDCFNRFTKFAGDKPSRLAWPQLLANKLNLECVNLSRPGNSCKRIWNDILSAELVESDLVIVLWTHASRWCIFKNEDTEDIAYYYETPTTNTYYRLFYNQHDSNVDMNLRISHASYHLTSKRIKNYHLVYKPSEYKKLDFNCAPTLNLNTSLNDLKKQYPKGVDANHPGEKAHEVFALDIYSNLNLIVDQS
jgi:hypothetical protein